MDLPRGLGNQHITYFDVNVDKHLNRKRNLKVFDAMIIIFFVIKVFFYSYLPYLYIITVTTITLKFSILESISESVL